MRNGRGKRPKRACSMVRPQYIKTSSEPQETGRSLPTAEKDSNSEVKLPILKFAPGSQYRRVQANGLVAIEASSVTGIERAVLPEHSIFLVDSHVRTRDVWEGQRLPEHEWHPGSVAFLPARTEVSSTPSEPYKETLMTLERADLIRSAREYVERLEYDLRYADITNPDTTEIAKMLQRLIASGENNAWPLLTDCLVLALTAAVVRALAPAEAAAAESKIPILSKSRHQRAIDFIEANLGNRIRLEEMADAAALSPFHFSRAFKQATGMSPSKYVLERRIRESKLLLKTTDKSLAEIALACGFASQSHFATAFKEHTGKTPGAFRRSLAALAGLVLTPWSELAMMAASI